MMELIAILIAIIALALIVVGLLLVLSNFMPTFGGGSAGEPGSLPVGAILFGVGLWLIFKAGGMA